MSDPNEPTMTPEQALTVLREFLDSEYYDDGLAALAVLEAEIERMTKPFVCEWTPDDNGIYETGCGHSYEITAGTPAENRMRFCCYCGGALVGAAAKGVGDADR